MWSIISREVEKTRSNCFKNSQNPGLLKIVLQSTWRIPGSNMKHKSHWCHWTCFSWLNQRKLTWTQGSAQKLESTEDTETRLLSWPRCSHVLLHQNALDERQSPFGTQRGSQGRGGTGHPASLPLILLSLHFLPPYSFWSRLYNETIGLSGYPEPNHFTISVNFWTLSGS